jgi:hypothetical protein
MAIQNTTPVVVNYTSKDFYSLRDDLITRVQARVNANGKQWSATDPSDFGVAFVEAMAYVGDVNSYYIDRVANESYLATAVQRQSILNIANMYGYIPAGYRQSTLDVTFSNPTDGDLTVPAGTLLSVDVVDTTSTSQTVSQLFFTVSFDVVIPAAVGGVAGVETGVVTHGREVISLSQNAADSGIPGDIAGELLGSSNGLANQSFTLANNEVVENSVVIFVKTGDTYSPWTQVDNLSDFLPTDPVYTLTTDGNNFVSVNFGDGVSGAIPSLDEPIKARYTIGGGLIGNISGGYRFSLLSTPASSGIALNTLGDIIATNTDSAFGGEDPESNDSIRTNAPKALKALTRAVTLADYANLSLYVSQVGKAVAYATSPNSVNLHIGPQVSPVSQDYYPGFDATNSTVLQTWYDLAANVKAYLADKSQIGTTVSVLPPTYVPITITIQYIKSPQFSDDEVIAAIKYILIYGYGYNFLDFNKVIYPENIERDLSNLESIISAKVTAMYRTGDSPSRSTLKAGNGEFFVFNTSGLSVYPSAGLSELTTSSGTLSPAFMPAGFTYAVTGVSTSTITVTPTAADTSATITVNGLTVTSGSPSSTISTPSSTTTTITIEVTSADETSSNSYVLKVTR